MTISSPTALSQRVSTALSYQPSKKRISDDLRQTAPSVENPNAYTRPSNLQFGLMLIDKKTPFLNNTKWLQQATKIEVINIDKFDDLDKKQNLVTQYHATVTIDFPAGKDSLDPSNSQKSFNLKSDVFYYPKDQSRLVTVSLTSKTNSDETLYFEIVDKTPPRQRRSNAWIENLTYTPPGGKSISEGDGQYYRPYRNVAQLRKALYQIAPHTRIERDLSKHCDCLKINLGSSTTTFYNVIHQA